MRMRSKFQMLKLQKETIYLRAEAERLHILTFRRRIQLRLSRKHFRKRMTITCQTQFRHRLS